jgi:hypothetical protein
MLERRLPSGIVDAVTDGERAAERRARGARGVGPALAGRDSGFNRRVQVGAQLVVEVTVVLAATDERAKT